MSRVVVTGGAGFIGSHLAEGLVKQGYQVIILDDVSTGKRENVERLLTTPLQTVSVQFIQNSVTDFRLLEAIFQRVDFVFHLAAIASVPSSIQDPFSSHSVNLTGTLNVLMAAVKNKVRKVIFVSSAAVYGDTTTLPQNEEMTLAPQSPYAVNKLAGEYYCKVFQDVYNLNTICLRYFNVYGPRQDPNSQYAAVIPKFISRVLEGKAPIIFGNGEQTRDFVFVKDVVAATILAAESDATGIYNIGSGNTVTINQLSQLVLKVAGKDLEPVYQESRSGDIMHSRANIAKAREFGYHPKYRLEDGLEETIHYIKQQARK